MAVREQAPSIATLQREAAEKHNRVLLHAAQTGHPVICNGLHCFVQCLVFNVHNGMTVYLTGDPTPLLADQVQLAPQIDKPETAPSAPGSKS